MDLDLEVSLTKYRIKTDLNFHYIVQKKFLFFWMRAKEPFFFIGGYYDKYASFDQYRKAKEYIEEKIREEERTRRKKEEYKKAKRSFVTKYFYPPLPDKEPM